MSELNYQLAVLDKEGKVIDAVPMASKNVIAMYHGASGTTHYHNTGLLQWDEKHVINQEYGTTIEKIKAQYSELLSHIVPSKIMVRINKSWQPSEKSTKNSMWYIEIKKASGDLNHALGYEYVLDMRDYWIHEWTEAQVHAAVMSQLLRIDPEDMSIHNLNNQQFVEKLGMTLGADYLKKGAFIPDILEEKMNFDDFKKVIDQQMSIDDVGQDEAEPAADPEE